MQFEHHGHGLSGYIPMAGTRLVLSPSSIVALSITMEAAFCVETLEGGAGQPGQARQAFWRQVVPTLVKPK